MNSWSIGASSHISRDSPGRLCPVPDEFVVAIQTRRELVVGIRSNGREVSIEVDDLGAVLAKVGALGGRVVMERSSIPGVGDLAFLANPSEDVVGVFEYVVR